MQDSPCIYHISFIVGLLLIIRYMVVIFCLIFLTTTCLLFIHSKSTSVLISGIIYIYSFQQNRI